nr:scytalone dehydratase [Quercus suber]
MPGPIDAQTKTLRTFIDAWTKWDVTAYLEVLDKDFVQVMMPVNMGIPPRSRAEVERHLPLVMGVVKNFKILHDVDKGKAVVHSRSTGETPFGPWANESSVFVTFSETVQRGGYSTVMLAQIAELNSTTWPGKMLVKSLANGPSVLRYSPFRFELASEIVDYRSFLNREWEAMPADEFVQMASSTHFLGNPLLRTQHFIGLGIWRKSKADEVVAELQLRVAHQKYKDDSMKEVFAKGHDHGTGTMWFKRIEGEWKFAGLRPNSRWAEFDMASIFPM